jgi:hypothetical protein
MLAIFFLLACVLALTFAAEKLSFDAMGFAASKNGAQLIAAGLRKKFFLDVYVVGLYSKSADSKDIKKATDFYKLAEGSSMFGPDSQLVLVFKRVVGTEQMVGGIVDALSGGDATYKKTLDAFKDVLKKGAGSKGFSPKDELVFANNGDKMDVLLNGKNVGTVSEAKELKKKLMNVYVSASGVAPEVHEILKARYLKK